MESSARRRRAPTRVSPRLHHPAGRPYPAPVAGQQQGPGGRVGRVALEPTWSQSATTLASSSSSISASCGVGESIAGQAWDKGDAAPQPQPPQPVRVSRRASWGRPALHRGSCPASLTRSSSASSMRCMSNSSTRYACSTCGGQEGATASVGSDRSAALDAQHPRLTAVQHPGRPAMSATHEHRVAACKLCPGQTTQCAQQRRASRGPGPRRAPRQAPAPTSASRRSLSTLGASRSTKRTA